MSARRHRRRRSEGPATLSITSMMDMMTIILIFLLRSFSTDDLVIAPSSDLRLPLSTATERPTVHAVVSVSASGIKLDGEPIADTGSAAAASGPAALRIPALINALREKAQRGSVDSKVDGEVLIACDRDTRFEVLRRVLYSAGEAGFPRYRFAVARATE
jgi:biopolymer transport protein ExbD